MSNENIVMEWQNEEDFYEGFYKKIRWEIKRSRFGTLNGYILINHAQIKREINIGNIHVHGGFTLEGSNQDFYVLGFDCSHAGDLVPRLFESYGNVISSLLSFETYKNVSFVKNEIVSVIDQLQKYITFEIVKA